MKRRSVHCRWSLCFAVVLTAAVSAFGVAGASASTPPADSSPIDVYEMDQPGFYEAPNPLPAVPHGTLLRYQPIAETAITSSGNFMRIMYTSETVSGEPIAVTGVAVLGPINGEWPRAGTPEFPDEGWSILTVGHGTTGLNLFCAPSLSLPEDGGRAFDISDVDRVVPDNGFVVVASDFQGLGTPGGHPYLVGQSAGKNMLDAALAIRQFPGIEISTTTASAGYSQGGGAAVWAGELAASYAPELRMLGTVAGAPATEVAALVAGGVSDPVRAPLSVSIVSGIATAYPEAAAATDAVLTRNGAELMQTMREHCFADVARVPRPPYLRGDPTAIEPFAGLMAANTPGQTTQQAPILIVQGDADENVPVGHTATLAARLCALGDTVERRLVPGKTHQTAQPGAYQAGIDWLVGLRDGAQPVSTC